MDLWREANGCITRRSGAMLLDGAVNLPLGCLETPLTQTTLICTHPWCHWRQPNRSLASLGPFLVIERHRARRIDLRSRCCEPSRCAPPSISDPDEAQEAPDPLMRSWDRGEWGMTSIEGVKWHRWSRDRCVLGRSCSRDRGLRIHWDLNRSAVGTRYHGTIT